MRWGYVILLIGAGLAIGGLILNGNPAAETLPQVPASYRLFPSLTQPEQIIGMELIIPEEEFAIAVVVEDNQEVWRLREEPFTRLDPQALQQARDILGLMEGFQTIQRRDMPLEAFGLLPNPQYVVRFQLEDLQVVTLYVGDQTPSKDAYYVSSGNDSVIVDLVSPFWVDNFVVQMLSMQPYEITEAATPTNSSE